MGMHEFQCDVQEWAEGEFGEQSAIQKLSKLYEEVIELAKEVSVGDMYQIGEECADVIMVAMHIASISGQNIEYHLNRKLSINRTRDWSKRKKGA